MDHSLLVHAKVQRERYSTNTFESQPYTNHGFYSAISNIVKNKLPHLFSKEKDITQRKPRFRSSAGSTSNRFKPFPNASNLPERISLVGSYEEEDVNFSDPESIYYYGLNAVTGKLPDAGSIEMEMYANAVRELASNLNNFDSTKNNCAICGGKGHTFADCPELNVESCKLREAYLRLRLAANRFRRAINQIDQHNGNKYNGDMNMLQTCRLSQLSADMTELPAYILSSLSRHDDSCLDKMEQQINTVTTAVHKTGNIVLDLHCVITTPSLH